MSKNTRTRILLVAVAALLLVTMTVGGTLAWLQADTTPVTNTFTPTTLSVTLTETKPGSQGGEAEMVPGATIEKDPKVSYTSDVDAWLFVQITESSNLDDFISYGIADGWTLVTGTDNVYYREVAASEAGGPFSVIEDAEGVADHVTVKDSVTKAMMDALIADESLNPTLAFKAYIIQKTAADTAADAWALVSGT